MVTNTPRITFKLSLALCTLAMLAGTLLNAQTHTPPSAADIAQRQVSHLTTLLNLTTDQQTQATTIFTAAATTQSSLRSSMMTAHKALATAVETNDAATIASVSTQIGTLTAQETQARATAEAAFYAILTADQQTKYKALHGAGEHGFGGRGPGGPGGDMPLPPGD